MERIDPDFSFKAKITRLKLSYFGQMMQRPRSLKKLEKKTMSSSKVDGQHQSGFLCKAPLGSLFYVFQSHLNDLQLSSFLPALCSKISYSIPFHLKLFLLFNAYYMRVQMPFSPAFESQQLIYVYAFQSLFQQQRTMKKERLLNITMESYCIHSERNGETAA